MKKFWIILALVAVCRPGPAPAVEPADVAVWGPASKRDHRLMDLARARWLQDAETFHALKSELWAEDPTDSRLVGEVVRWYRDAWSLRDLLGAVAEGRAEEFTGLPGLGADQRLLVEGMARSMAGYRATGLDRIAAYLAIHPADPEALSSYLAFQVYPDSVDAILERGIRDAECAVEITHHFVSLSPDRIGFEYRDVFLEVAGERPPRPMLAAELEVAGILHAIEQPATSYPAFAAALDGFHEENPAVFAAYLATMLGTGASRVPVARLHEYLRERSAWLPPRRFAWCTAYLAAMADLSFETYRALWPPGDTGPLAAAILQTGADWHGDPAGFEHWALECAREDLDTSWSHVMQVLRERGQGARADSLRAVVEAEIPFHGARRRVGGLRDRDAPAASALLDSLVEQHGERWFGWELLAREEGEGRTRGLDRSVDLFGMTETLRILPAAIHEARLRKDKGRLDELAGFVHEHAPRNTMLLRQLVHAAIELGRYSLANRLIGELETLDLPAHLVLPLATFLAQDLSEVGRVREHMEAMVASPGFPPGLLQVIPGAAARYGWMDVAEAALDSLRGRVDPGSRLLQLAEADVLVVAGDLETGRSRLLDLIASWPGWDPPRGLLTRAGGGVQVYLDPDPDGGGPDLAGVTYDLEGVDWIARARSVPGEFPGQDLLVLRNRQTYLLSSHHELTSQFRYTVEILTDPGAALLETVRIPFDPEDGIPRLLCARIVLPDGEVRPIPREQIYVTSHQGEEAAVSDQRDLVIPFGGLGRGMVVDYCTRYPSQPFLDIGTSWEYRFGDFAPQREEILEFIASDGIAYDLRSGGRTGTAEVVDLPGAVLHRWRIADGDPLELVPMAPLEDLLPDWVGATTIPSWGDLARDYGRYFEVQVVPTSEADRLAQRLVADGDSERERAELLFGYVQERIATIGIQLGQGRLVPTPAHEVLQRGYGDCKDKVATLVALAGAVGIDCVPALVGTRPRVALDPDFVNPFAFDHIIAYFPDVDGGVFADPTLGLGCLDDLPPEVAGRTALLVDPEDGGRLVALPEIASDVPDIDLQVDLHPRPDGRLRADVTADLRQQTGQFMAYFLDYPDSVFLSEMVKILVGNRFDDSMVLVDWEGESLGCDGVRLRAVFDDSLWTHPGSHAGQLVWTSASDFEVELPAPEGRDLPVVLDVAWSMRVTLRAFEEEGWRLSRRHSPYKSDVGGFRAAVEVADREEEGRRWFEIRRTLDFSRRIFDPGDYPEIHEGYYGYRLAGVQPFRFQRATDTERLAALRAYCREHPADFAFALQAAVQILGPDMGGDGEEGRERRRIAREMLGPALESPDCGSRVFMTAAGAALADQEFLVADSLVTRGLARNPQDLFLLGTAIRICGELDDQERLRAHLERGQSLSGEEWYSYALIRLHVERGDAEAARREEDRLRLMAARVDSVQLLQAKFSGCLAAADLAGAKDLIAAGSGLLDDDARNGMLAVIAAREHRWDEAIELTEPFYRANPIDPGICNDLSWYLACAGRDLERAEYLVRTSIALSGRRSTSDNTLAVVLLRQGRADEALKMLSDLQDDDRPSVQVTNGYFVGLCHWLEGEREEAVTVWRSLAGIAPRDPFAHLARESLTMAEAGEDPAWVYLRAPVAEAGSAGER